MQPPSALYKSLLLKIKGEKDQALLRWGGGPVAQRVLQNSRQSDVRKYPSRRIQPGGKIALRQGVEFLI